MAFRLFLASLCVFGVGHNAARTAWAQGQAQGAYLRGEGAFLRGAGWYNLNTAKAEAIQADTMIQWKTEFRKTQAERRELQARKEAGNKLQHEEARRRMAMREYALRVNPTSDDVLSGQALNALFYDLSDPAISTSAWMTSSVPLPEGLSVKDLIFRFIPQSARAETSKTLGRGVIALARLDVTGDDWPTALRQLELQPERTAYEKAYARLRDQFLKDKFEHISLDAFDKSLEALKAKVQKVVPEQRGFRDEAIKYVNDLVEATRMFDASTVDYAQEIIVDTNSHDAKTVGELVAFMLKYRLQFASSGRSVTARELYPKIYGAMQAQVKVLGIEPPPELPPAAAPVPAVADAFAENSVWVSLDGNMVLTVKTRTKDSFRGRFEVGKNVIREISGKIHGNEIEWLAKDTKVIKGDPGHNNHGVITKDSNGDVIFFEYGKSGKYTMRRK